MGKGKTHHFKTAFSQLGPRRGSYFFLEVKADLVANLSRGRSTRVICTIADAEPLRCGLNHLGDGNFFIIVATRIKKKMGWELGHELPVELIEDPDPLGVDLPEALEVLLEQDEDVAAAWKGLTDGKKRSLAISVQRTKDVDLQVRNILKGLGLG